MKQYDEINIYDGIRPYDPEYHAGHIDVLQCESRIIYVCKGRRWGKTFTISLKVIDCFLNYLFELSEEIRKGDRHPWLGLGLPRNAARRKKEDALQALVIAPSTKQLDQCRGLIETHLYRSGADCFLHPDVHLAHHERPSETWFLLDGAAGVIDYMVSTRGAQIVGSRTRILWLNECAYIDASVHRQIKPMLWEYKARVFGEGTPQPSESHWFTKEVISGLPVDHERANIKLAKPNPEVKSFLGSALEAYSPTAREEAAKDRKASGEDSVYSRTEIDGDWRTPQLLVFSWSAQRHLCSLSFERGQSKLVINDATYYFDLPDLYIGGIDWYLGAAPAGFVVNCVWHDNPIAKDDPRPLVVTIDEYTTPKAGYSDDGYFAQLKQRQLKYPLLGWYYDPTSVVQAKNARNNGVLLLNTDNKDKTGRIGLIQRQLHCTDTIKPAMLVDKTCKRMAKQLAEFKRGRDKEGNPTEKFVSYEDWLVDAQAYIMPQIQMVGIAGAPFGE